MLDQGQSTQRWDLHTGKSFSEALILASTNPQYDIELLVQYMKTTSSEHGVCINFSECQNKNKKQSSKIYLYLQVEYLLPATQTRKISSEHGTFIYVHK